MKRIILLLFALLCYTGIINGQNPAYSCKLTNATQLSCNTYEFDLILQRTGTTVFNLATFQFGINIAPAIIPSGGVITVSPVPGSSEISNLVQRPTPDKFTFDAVNNCIRITPMVPPGYANGSIIANTPQGTRLCRVRVTCSQPFNIGVSTSHAWSFSMVNGYATKIFAYVGNLNTDVTVQASHVFTGTSNVLISDFSAQQQLISVSPNQGNSGSLVTTTISGSFANITSVKLTKPSFPDIVLPYFLNGGSCGNEITSTFYLPGQLYGFYDLSVITADTAMVLPNAFMIDTMTSVQTQAIFFHEDFEPPSNGDSVIASGTTNFSLNSRLHNSGTQCDSVFVSAHGAHYLTTNSFSTIGYSNVKLSFAHICKVEILDSAIVEVSVNNGSWVKLNAAQYINPGNSQFVTLGNRFNAATYPQDWVATNNAAKPTQSWWKNETFDISTIAGNQANVRVRFALYDANGNGAMFCRGWYIDDIKITSSNNPVSQCQASFTHSFNPTGGTYVNLYDASHNLDSSPINITTWTWMATYGGTVHTYTGPNPVMQLNGFTGNIPVCLTITTFNCQSSWCDSITINSTPPVDTCTAAYTYVDTPTHLVHFIDQSSTTNGTVNSWHWVITNANTGAAVYNSNNYQSPYVQLAANLFYNVCLSISSDSGCTTTHCGNVYIQDTTVVNTGNPSYICKLTNAAQVSCNAYEFDLILQRTGTTVFKLANFQFGINLAPGIIPAGGNISVSPVAGSSQISNAAQQPTPDRFTFDSIHNCIRITPMVPPGYANGSIITNVPPGIRLCRVRVTCSQPFNNGVNTAHAWSFSMATGYASKIFAYVGNTNTDVTNQASYSLAGTYNVVTHDFTVNRQLNSITPNQGYSGSIVTATINGIFNNVTGVKLTKPTQPDINLPYFLNSGLNCGNEITSTFSLPNQAHGYYNLEVTTADTTMILHNAFRIDTVAVVTPNCHAFFITQYDPVTDTLKLIDHSYNPDSNLLNVTSWNWTVHVGTSSYTFNSQNPSIYVGGSIGNAYVCLTLYTSSSTPCQSSYCDSVSLLPPPIYCNAGYQYQLDTLNHTLALTDNSYTSTGSVNSWAWNISLNGTQLFTSNLQNPVFNYTVNGIYHICLSTTTDSGCVAQYCSNIYIPDSELVNHCQAAFSYILDPVSYLSNHFYDQSYTNNGTITSWVWTVKYNGNVIGGSTGPNAYMSFWNNGVYDICLVIGTDHGCHDGICKTIVVPDTNNSCNLVVSSNISHVSTINGTDGHIDLTVTGGYPPYSYLWSTGSTTQDIYNLAVGNYTVTISTTPLCPSYVYSYNILQPYDSNNFYVDTLYSPVVDTCLNFVIDSFYIAGITVQGNSVTVQWVFTGGGVTATLNTTYTYSYYGSQVVILSVSCGSKDIAKYTGYIYISDAYGVLENPDDPQIYLYPNPVTDFLNITFSKPNVTYTTLKIFNTAGQLVFEQPIDMDIKQVGINVGELPKGVYFIRLNTDDSQTIVKKFLK